MPSDRAQHAGRSLTTIRMRPHKRRLFGRCRDVPMAIILAHAPDRYQGCACPGLVSGMRVPRTGIRDARAPDSDRECAPALLKRAISRAGGAHA
jgi:hypothetical protein